MSMCYAWGKLMVVWCSHVLVWPGGKLVDLLNERLVSGALPEEQVLKIFTEVCQPVARLHHRTKPITHRDIKVRA